MDPELRAILADLFEAWVGLAESSRCTGENCVWCAVKSGRRRHETARRLREYLEAH